MSELIIYFFLLVPPSVPLIGNSQTTSFEATITLEHTNTTPDDAPDMITLTLSDSLNNTIDIYEIAGHHTEFTFYNLTPSRQYYVKLSVRNIDGYKVGETIKISTKTAGY